MTQSCMTSAHHGSTKSGRKNGVSCQSEIWTAGSSSTWKVDDGAHSLGCLGLSWPRKEIHRTWEWLAIYFHCGVYVLWFRLFYLIVYLYEYIYIYILYLYTCWRRVSIETFERSWCLNFRICLSVCFASASFHVLKFGYVPLDVFIRHLLCIVLFFAVKKKQRETAAFLATFFSLCHQLRIGLFKRRGCSCCFRCPGSTSHQIPCEL